MVTEKRTLEKIGEPDLWRVTDNDYGIIVDFREHKFNETQRVTLLGGDEYKAMANAMAVAHRLQLLGGWLFKRYYDIAMPPKKDKRKEFGQLLKDTREKIGLSLEDLSIKTRFRANTLQSIENGRFSMDVDDLFNILDVLDVKITFVKK